MSIMSIPTPPTDRFTSSDNLRRGAYTRAALAGAPFSWPWLASILQAAVLAQPEDYPDGTLARGIASAYRGDMPPFDLASEPALEDVEVAWDDESDLPFLVGHPRRGCWAGEIRDRRIFVTAAEADRAELGWLRSQVEELQAALTQSAGSRVGAPVRRASTAKAAQKAGISLDSLARRLSALRAAGIDPCTVAGGPIRVGEGRRRTTYRWIPSALPEFMLASEAALRSRPGVPAGEQAVDLPSTRRRGHGRSGVQGERSGSLLSQVLRDRVQKRGRGHA